MSWQILLASKRLPCRPTRACSGLGYWPLECWRYQIFVREVARVTQGLDFTKFDRQFIQSLPLKLVDIALKHKGSAFATFLLTLFIFRRSSPRLNFKNCLLAGNFYRSAPVKQSRECEFTRKEVMKMKKTKFVITMVFLAGVIGTGATSAPAQDVVSKAAVAAGSYCHMKFPAISEKTLFSDRPQVESSTSADVIDFYGPCDESPAGKDQVIEQRQEEERDWRE